MVSGEVITAIAMTEPGAGSDLQGVRTTAVRDGNHYVVSGSKTYITNGQKADLVVVVAFPMLVAWWASRYPARRAAGVDPVDALRAQ